MSRFLSVILGKELDRPRGFPRPEHFKEVIGCRNSLTIHLPLIGEDDLPTTTGRVDC